jgi:FkbM family methyltransferase
MIAPGSETSALGEVFAALRADTGAHVPGCAAYLSLKAKARSEIVRLFSGTEPEQRPFGPFGTLALPYTKMGAIDSLDLFGLDELIIFAFYDANRGRYGNVLDIGANLGLHSLILGKCGFSVRAFEPDPRHFGILSANLKANGQTRVEAVEAAVSTQDGVAEFVRVLGNTTGSHLSGAKQSYGERDVFTVPVRAASPLFEWASLAKIDAEGHEKEILLASTRHDFEHLDVMVEVGSAANAEGIFHYFTELGVGMFPQKLAWQKAANAADLPTSHRDGSLFLSAKDRMPW